MNPILILAATVALLQAQPHTVLVRHPPAKVLTWALDGLQQMGYTIQHVDSAAGTVVAERLGRLDPQVGSRFDELDVKIAVQHGDTTLVQITTVSWTQLLQAAKRHRDPAPSARAEEDAGRLLDVLK